jgi:CRP/FNR family transcriptional regulator, cyclic AMP receptor protein
VQPILIPDQVDAHRLLAQLGSGRTTIAYADNEKIYGQDEDAAFVFFVQEGRVKLTAISKEGFETSLGTAGEGQFFGEACLHDVPVRIATATAIGDCRITSVTKRAMLAALKNRPRFAKMFVDYLLDHNGWVQKSQLDHLLNSVSEPSKQVYLTNQRESRKLAS